MASKPKPSWQALVIELALFEAWLGNRVPEAKGWLARARGSVVGVSRRALARAA